MPQGADKVLQHQVGVEGARPYGVAGNQPADAVVTAIKPNGRGVVYPSDRPYVPPTLAYNERPLCSGTRRDNASCKAKARPEGVCCEAHIDQE